MSVYHVRRHICFTRLQRKAGKARRTIPNHQCFLALPFSGGCSLRRQAQRGGGGGGQKTRGHSAIELRNTQGALMSRSQQIIDRFGCSEEIQSGPFPARRTRNGRTYPIAHGSYIDGVSGGLHSRTGVSPFLLLLTLCRASSGSRYKLQVCQKDPVQYQRSSPKQNDEISLHAARKDSLPVLPELPEHVLDRQQEDSPHSAPSCMSHTQQAKDTK